MDNIDHKVISVLANAVDIIRKNAPIDTGNLRYNSIRLMRVAEGHYCIYVDDNIAPYAPITNDKWEHKTINQGNFKKGGARDIFRTWDNPNEGWWDKAVKEAVDYIAKELGGKLKK